MNMMCLLLLSFYLIYRFLNRIGNAVVVIIFLSYLLLDLSYTEKTLNKLYILTYGWDCSC